MATSSTASKWAAGGDTFTKHGMVHEDHHFKTSDGKQQASPPSKLKAMYDYLPTELMQSSDKLIPAKLVITAEINALKMQAHCLGSYQVVPDRQHNGYPIWKHATADLCVASCKIEEEDAWAVVRWTTLGKNAGQRCMQVQVPSKTYPFGSSLVWSSWSGRDWTEEPSVKCRPSYHGFGLEPLGTSHNTESSVSPPRSTSPGKKRGTGSPPAAIK